MNVSPILLLTLGIIFATLYGLIITFGWARTRINRHIIQYEKGISVLPTLILNSRKKNVPQRMKTVSILRNNFLDHDGLPIDLSKIDAYVAVGSSKKYPNIKNGNLVFLDKKNGKILYAFDVPNLRHFR